jgi:hypothetical protein
MNKKILKSNSAFVLIGEKLPITLSKDRGRLFSLVQGCEFSIQTERQKLKSIGTDRYIVNNLIKAPSVDLNFQYYLSPYINNELLMGFGGSGRFFEPVFKNLQGVNNNFYIMIEKDDLRDGFDEIKKQTPDTINFSGFDVLSFGNSYLKKYSLSFNLGQVPVVNTVFACSNMKFDNLNNNTLKIPSVSSYGVEDNKTLNLSELYLTITSGYVSGNPEGKSEYNLPVADTMASSFILDDLQISGVPLEFLDRPILQSFSIDIDIPRNDLYGLGSNYVFDRKIQYPINATININTLVSGFNSGVVSKIHSNEEVYGFSVNFVNKKRYVTGSYKFSRLRLENFNYNLNINDTMNYNATFSCEITKDRNFEIKRMLTSVGATYLDIEYKWSQSEIIWNMD